MNAVEVTKEEFQNLLETWITECDRHEKSVSEEIFWCKEGNLYIGADNTYGDFFVEEFHSKEALFFWIDTGIKPSDYEVVNVTSDSCEMSERIIYTVYVGQDTYVDVMYLASEDDYYILDITDGWRTYQAYREDDGGVDFFFDEGEVIETVKHYRKVVIE